MNGIKMKYLALSLLLALPSANVLASAPISTSDKDNQVQSLYRVPSAPINYPSHAASPYKPLGLLYSIDLDSVWGATYYKLYESDTGSNYSLAYTGNDLSADFVHYNIGYHYYKYQACNPSGCSGFSPARRFYVYSAPAVPKNPNINTVYVAGTTVNTLSWGASNGSVDGTVYTVYQSANGGSETIIHQQTRNHWSEQSYSFPLSSQLQGDYTYRIQACSPMVACSGSASVSALF